MTKSSAPVSEPQSDGPAPTSYGPYGQLVKMLLPSAGSMAIYDAGCELVWCSDGCERPDLRQLVEAQQSVQSTTPTPRGDVTRTAADVPAFLSVLNGSYGEPLGFVVLELGENSRHSSSVVSSLLRPVLDCLENRLNLERTVLNAGRDDHAGIDLLLSVDDDDREDATALERLVRHCVQHLNCALGTLLVPDKNLVVTCGVDDDPIAGSAARLLDRTQRHLLAWVQLNNRPMVVNRVGAAGADVGSYKILSCPVRDPHNRVTGLIALFREVGAEDFELRDIRILEFVSRKAVSILNSQYDPLTGLINRLIFERRMQSSLDGPAVNGSRALLYVDIDRLQIINDAFGFQAGDEVIQRLGEVIRSGLGAADLASRIGGDRFALYLPHSTAEQARETAERIIATLSQLGYLNGEQSMPVSASIGIALSGERGSVGTHLLAAAELACKRAKHLGRNQIEMHSESNLLMLARREQSFASASLQEALKNNDFRLEAQPIRGLAARPDETIGFEILVRMRSRTGEHLAPDKFIDAAERYELMPALDRWVLCSAIDTLKTRAEAIAQSPYCFTINVSAQSLVGGGFPRFALEQLAAAGLPPEAFCFEIKEAAAVNHLREAERFIAELAAAGCKIALDDFGCGLSSLAHLKRLPVHYLKIDGSFVRRVLTDRVAESIVSGITSAAATLGVNTIGEHVESLELADKLRRSGVDFGQGFFFGKPRSFATIVSEAIRGSEISEAAAS